MRMPKSIPEATPSLNRLRAAAALLPIIESGLRDSKLSTDRAALMATFCEWAAQHPPGTESEDHLISEIRAGLDRVKQSLQQA